VWCAPNVILPTAEQPTKVAVKIFFRKEDWEHEQLLHEYLQKKAVLDRQLRDSLRTTVPLPADAQALLQHAIAAFNKPSSHFPRWNTADPLTADADGSVPRVIVFRWWDFTLEDIVAPCERRNQVLGNSEPSSAEYALKAARLVASCAGSLAALHRHKVLVGDIKPSNILLSCSPSGDIRSAHGDLGFAGAMVPPSVLELPQSVLTPWHQPAHQLGPSLWLSGSYGFGELLAEVATRMRDGVGTPPFRAPEGVSKGRIPGCYSECSDIYSLALSLLGVLLPQNGRLSSSRLNERDGSVQNEVKLRINEHERCAPQSPLLSLLRQLQRCARYEQRWRPTLATLLAACDQYIDA
jgi:hypothetical protein